MCFRVSGPFQETGQAICFDFHPIGGRGRCHFVQIIFLRDVVLLFRFAFVLWLFLSEVRVKGEDVIFLVGHNSGFLVVAYSSFEEVCFPFQGDEVHKGERVVCVEVVR